MSSHIWNLVLNIFKLVGVIIVGASGLVGILHETKTEDKKHLSGAGRFLLILGIVGFTFALGAQIAEWVKGNLEDEEKQMQTLQTLSEIKRSVTRFDAIDVSLSYGLPFRALGFQHYFERLNELVDDLNSQGDDVKVGEDYMGLKVMSRDKTPTLLNSVISIGPQSPAMPELPDKAKHSENDGDAARLCNLIPMIAFFRHPLTGKDFMDFDYIGAFATRTADLTFSPRGGATDMLIVQRDDAAESGISSIGVRHMLANAPRDAWTITSDQFLSVQDVPGSQIIVYLPLPQADGVVDLWNKTQIGITLFFNHQMFPVPKLERVQPHGVVFYSYIFPIKDGSSKSSR